MKQEIQWHDRCGGQKDDMGWVPHNENAGVRMGGRNRRRTVFTTPASSSTPPYLEPAILPMNVSVKPRERRATAFLDTQGTRDRRTEEGRGGGGGSCSSTEEDDRSRDESDMAVIPVKNVYGCKNATRSGRPAAAGNMGNGNDHNQRSRSIFLDSGAGGAPAGSEPWLSSSAGVIDSVAAFGTAHPGAAGNNSHPASVNAPSHPATHSARPRRVGRTPARYASYVLDDHVEKLSENGITTTLVVDHENREQGEGDVVPTVPSRVSTSSSKLASSEGGSEGIEPPRAIGIDSRAVGVDYPSQPASKSTRPRRVGRTPSRYAAYVLDDSREEHQENGITGPPTVEYGNSEQGQDGVVAFFPWSASRSRSNPDSSRVRSGRTEYSEAVGIGYDAVGIDSPSHPARQPARTRRIGKAPAKCTSRQSHAAAPSSKTGTAAPPAVYCANGEQLQNVMGRVTPPGVASKSRPHIASSPRGYAGKLCDRVGCPRKASFGFVGDRRPSR